MTFPELLSIVSNGVQVLTGAVVLWVYFTKRTQIADALNTYVRQKAYEDVERLVVNCLRFVDADFEVKKIEPQIAEIVGRLRGNANYSNEFREYLKRLEELTSDQKKITAPKIKSLLGELHEMLRNHQSSQFKSSPDRGENG